MHQYDFADGAAATSNMHMKERSPRRQRRNDQKASGKMPRRQRDVASPPCIQHTHIRMLRSLFPRIDHVADHSADAAAVLEATRIDVKDKGRQFGNLAGLHIRWARTMWPEIRRHGAARLD